jgi:hypothetical protein
VRVANIKQVYGTISPWTILATGVNFTPLPDDPAHADLTFYGWLANESNEESERFLIWLSAILQALHYPSQLHHLPNADIPPSLADSRFKKFATSCIARIRQTLNF